MISENIIIGTYNTDSNPKVLKDILIHTCCADCLLNAINNLEERGMIDKKTEIISFFFNPNIHPRTEYLERLNAVKKVIPQLKDKWSIRLVIPNYSPKEYMKEVMKGDRKFGIRCQKCWEIRLETSLKYAKEKNLKNITTTLLTSNYQSKKDIMDIFKELNKKYELNIVQIDNCSNEKHTGFYKQNYCGCCFSLTEKMVESYE